MARLVGWFDAFQNDFTIVTRPKWGALLESNCSVCGRLID
jgi:hypothetical protein